MINYSCYVTDQTSYGLASLNILKELCKIHNDISLFPIGLSGNVTERQYLPSVNTATKNSEVFNPAIASVKVDHHFNMHNSIGYGNRFGLTFFEMNQFTEKESSRMDSLDRLMVSSKWAKDICDAGLKVPTSVVPLGVDRDIFNPQDYKPDKCIFITIGKWEVRKDQDGIVQAFNSAFSNNDNVELWMLFESHHISRKILEEKTKEYKESKLGDKIKILRRVPNQGAVARLMQQSFCFVSNSKAEAWNMEVIEAMSCGKYCISPCYSGESEYINTHNTFVTDHKGLEFANDNQWFGNTPTQVNIGEWCVPNLNSLIANMKHTYEIYDSDEPYLNEEGIKTSTEFTWVNTVRQLKKAIEC